MPSTPRLAAARATQDDLALRLAYDFAVAGLNPVRYGRFLRHCERIAARSGMTVEAARAHLIAEATR